jgi:uncharacterized glyoxalase superfamily protein PhnB
MLGACPDATPPTQLGDHSYFAYLVVDDVDGYYEDLKAKEAATFSVPTSQPWGMREFGLATPDGHRINDRAEDRLIDLGRSRSSPDSCRAAHQPR